MGTVDDIALAGGGRKRGRERDETNQQRVKYTKAHARALGNFLFLLLFSFYVAYPSLQLIYNSPVSDVPTDVS